jgi:tRNA (cmo5U34)-methyltransferase
MSSVGDNIKASNASWNFGGDVAKTFDSHVAKSVPLYYEGHTLITKISDFFLEQDSLCYELGCSTGVLSQKLSEHHVGRGVRFIGVDNQEPMIETARTRTNWTENVSFVTSDIIDFEFEPCDMIAAYYTVQFIRPKYRQTIIDSIYQALNWGGAFLLFEKVRASDARFQDIMTSVYTDFKIDQGYDTEEIVGKTRSLKGVLEPFSTQGNIDLLKRAGFVDVLPVMKYACFEGFLAIK